MKNRWIIYLVLFLLTANVAILITQIVQNKRINGIESQNKEKRFRMQRHEAKFEEHLSTQLGFNDEQKNEVHIYSDEFHQKRKDLKHELSGLKKDYFDALSQANPDTLLLGELANEIGVIEAEKIKLEYIHYKNIRSVCNKAQAQKMDSLGRLRMHRKFKKSNSEHFRRHKNSEKSNCN